MYLIANLAVGGDWPGAPDATTRFPEPAEDRLRAGSGSEDPGGPPPGVPPAQGRPAARAAAAAGVRARLNVPLYRNGYALVASSGLTSVLGLVYWLMAARLYTPQAVGVSAALISAMTLLANLAQLNLKSALNRFLPRAGSASAGLRARAATCSRWACLPWRASSSSSGSGLWAPQSSASSLDRPGLAAVVRRGHHGVDDLRAPGQRAGRDPPGALGAGREPRLRGRKIAVLVAVVATAPDAGRLRGLERPAAGAGRPGQRCCCSGG